MKAIQTTPRELIRLGYDLFEQAMECQMAIDCVDTKKAMKQKFVVPIVNKTKACDEWRFK